MGTTSGYISINPAAVEAAKAEIVAAAASTETNHALSQQVLTANYTNMQGEVQQGFEQALTILNSAYEESKELIRAAGQAVGMAGENFCTMDSALRGQYA